MAEGSSPLARGLLADDGLSRDRGGIIPARAGFTGGLADTTPPQGDHPRSRGVYSTTSALSISALGSSPLARGLLIHRNVEIGLMRIIPARAGFTLHPPGY